MINIQTTGRIVAASPLALVVKVNGGSVKVEIQAAGTWVEIKNYTEDSAELFHSGGATYRITPTGGATYSLGGA